MRRSPHRLCTHVVLALVLFAATAFCNEPDPSIAAEVDDYVRAQMNLLHIPGLSLAVAKDGRVIYQNAYGLADVELNVPVTADTVFQIQSITKTFTAAAIMMLVEEQKVALDDPVSKYLDGTPESWRPITIRHLLNHTSGIKDFINEPTASLRLDVTEQQVLEAAAPRPLDFPPGQRYAYSNTGYHLLAMVIRRVTGKSYGGFLAERVFKPLGMTHTRVQDLSELVPGRARGYLWRNGRLANGDFVAQPILSYGGGGILSTANDLAKWDAALRNETLLRKPTLDQMWTPATLNDGKKSKYGLGWGVNSYSVHRYVEHSGGHVTGFQSVIRRYLDNGLTVILLINQQGEADAGKIAARIAGMFISELAPPVYKPIEDKEPQIAALVKELYQQASRGELKEEGFDPAFWPDLSPHLTALRDFALAAGPIESLALVERREDNGQRLYRYRIAVKDGAWLVLLGLGRDGKICNLEIEPAED
jgi:CubicO group peptidase (beta-lactamase class C family)